jgi:hypothetical protein
MKKKYNQIINQISNARKKNNENWMQLLKISFKFAPEESKKILFKINSQDQKISKLVKKLND